MKNYRYNTYIQIVQDAHFFITEIVTSYIQLIDTEDEGGGETPIEGSFLNHLLKLYT